MQYLALLPRWVKVFNFIPYQRLILTTISKHPTIKRIIENVCNDQNQTSKRPRKEVSDESMEVVVEKVLQRLTERSNTGMIKLNPPQLY